MKWLPYLILAALVAGSFWFYQHAIDEQTRIKREISELRQQQIEDRDENTAQQITKLKNEAESKASGRILSGILLTFMGAGLLGILFVTFILPALAHSFAHAVYDSGETLEKDAMHDARSLVAQGEYSNAIEAFKAAAANDPLNRLPWVEIARIQRNNLQDSEGAILTLRAALEDQEWQMSDAAYLLFRLAELYDEDRQDRATAASIMRQVIDEFPETRHSANARHRLHDWGLA
ncbi:MAG: tetratricopeptide repeat protein [Verrucomicrobiota bacterium]